MLIQTLGHAEKIIRDLDLLIQITKQARDGMSPSFSAHCQEYRFDCLLSRLMCGEASPIIISILQSMLRML